MRERANNIVLLRLLCFLGVVASFCSFCFQFSMHVFYCSLSFDASSVCCVAMMAVLLSLSVPSSFSLPRRLARCCANVGMTVMLVDVDQVRTADIHTLMHSDARAHTMHTHISTHMHTLLTRTHSGTQALIHSPTHPLAHAYLVSGEPRPRRRPRGRDVQAVPVLVGGGEGTQPTYMPWYLPVPS